MTSKVPQAIDEFFSTRSRRDIAAATAAFSRAAMVRDEHQDHVGPAAIRRWIEDTVARSDRAASIHGAEYMIDGGTIPTSERSESSA